MPRRASAPFPAAATITAHASWQECSRSWHSGLPRSPTAALVDPPGRRPRRAAPAPRLAHAAPSSVCSLSLSLALALALAPSLARSLARSLPLSRALSPSLSPSLPPSVRPSLPPGAGYRHTDGCDRTRVLYGRSTTGSHSPCTTVSFRSSNSSINSATHSICEFSFATGREPSDRQAAGTHEPDDASAHGASACRCLASQLGLLEAVPASPGRGAGGHGLAR